MNKISIKKEEKKRQGLPARVSPFRSGVYAIWHKTLLCAMTCLLCISCGDRDVQVEPGPTEEVLIQKVTKKDHARDALYASLAKGMANNFGNQNLRTFLKEQTSAKFDGDYNFLFEKAKDVEIPSPKNGRGANLRFGELLLFGDDASRNIPELLTTISEEYPLLQIALPQLEADSAESWVIENEVPLVAFLPSDYEERNSAAVIPAYDVNGNLPLAIEHPITVPSVCTKPSLEIWEW